VQLLNLDYKGRTHHRLALPRTEYLPLLTSWQKLYGTDFAKAQYYH
jgi:hypothetical protein